MQASDLLYRLQDAINQYGDPDVYDSDGFPIEDLALNQNNELTIYSEGDEH